MYIFVCMPTSPPKARKGKVGSWRGVLVVPKPFFRCEGVGCLPPCCSCSQNTFDPRKPRRPLLTKMLDAHKWHAPIWSKPYKSKSVLTLGYF